MIDKRDSHSKRLDDNKVKKNQSTETLMKKKGKSRNNK
jgi:hypothetical protein